MRFIQLRKYVFLDYSVGFWRWLPDGLSNALEVEINGISIKTCVHLEYGETLSFPMNPEQISGSNSGIKAFFVYLTVPIADETDEDLYNLSPPEELLSSVATALKQHLSTLYGIVRNDIGQYRVQSPHEIQSLDIGQMLINTEIQNLEGKWVGFCVGKICGKSPIPSPDDCIDKDRWFGFKELIESGYRCDLSLVFLRNAESYFYEGNLRLAIVEACIALERAISKFMPQFISSNQKGEYESILNGDSLTEKAKHLLPLTKDDHTVTDTTINACVDAVNLRNQVIHRSRVRLLEGDIGNALNSIKSVLGKLNPRIFHPIAERLR